MCVHVCTLALSAGVGVAARTHTMLVVCAELLGLSKVLFVSEWMRAMCACLLVACAEPASAEALLCCPLAICRRRGPPPSNEGWPRCSNLSDEREEEEVVGNKGPRVEVAGRSSFFHCVGGFKTCERVFCSPLRPEARIKTSDTHTHGISPPDCLRGLLRLLQT